MKRHPATVTADRLADHLTRYNGGLTPDEAAALTEAATALRALASRPSTAPRAPIQHGTNNGYVEHSQRGDTTRWNSGELDPCEPCKTAHAAYMRENRATHRLLRAAGNTGTEAA